MEHATHEVKVDAIYKVAKLKKEVAYSDFDFIIGKFDFFELI